MKSLREWKKVRWKRVSSELERRNEKKTREKAKELKSDWEKRER